MFASLLWSMTLTPSFLQRAAKLQGDLYQTITASQDKTFTQDTCHTGSTSTLPDGTVTTCLDNHVDKIAAFISTAGTAGANGGDAAHAKLLNASITVAGASVSKTLFVTNPDGLVNQNSSCGQDSNAVLGVR